MKIDEDLIKKTAQLWCLPQHEKKVMDPDFAESIAQALQEVRDEEKRVDPVLKSIWLNIEQDLKSELEKERTALKHCQTLYQGLVEFKEETLELYREECQKTQILAEALDKIANALPPNALSMVAGKALTKVEKKA